MVPIHEKQHRSSIQLDFQCPLERVREREKCKYSMQGTDLPEKTVTTRPLNRQGAVTCHTFGPSNKDQLQSHRKKMQNAIFCAELEDTETHNSRF